MQVTEIKIVLVNQGGLRAYANITFDNCFVVNDVEIIQGANGLFLAMPARQLSDGTSLDIFSPAGPEIAKELQDVVIAEYTRQMIQTTVPR